MGIGRRLPALASGTLCALAACGAGAASNDPGPQPGAGHREIVRERVEAIDREQVSPGARATGFEIGAPVLDDIPRWHFEPETPGQSHEFASLRGWRVDFRYTPEFPGYPEQPERTGMAFFIDGRLRGIFAEGGGNAPLGLDRWSARWVDPTFDAIAASKPPQRASPR